MVLDKDAKKVLYPDTDLVTVDSNVGVTLDDICFLATSKNYIL